MGVSSGNLIICPYRRNLRCLILLLHGTSSVFKYKFTLLILAGHLMFMTLRRRLRWKLSMVSAVVCVIVHVSLLYKNMLVTQALNTLSFVFRLTRLSLRMWSMYIYIYVIYNIYYTYNLSQHATKIPDSYLLRFCFLSLFASFLSFFFSFLISFLSAFIPTIKIRMKIQEVIIEVKKLS